MSSFAGRGNISSPEQTNTGEIPTYASFSPTSSVNHTESSKSKTTILVHKKSPLLVATPPQVTRALAYSHPFILPLNKLFGLLSWTTDDPWESFLLVASFWGSVLYGDVIIRWAGPILVVVALILGLYSRRFSPLSTRWTSLSTAESNPKSPSHKRKESEHSANVRHHKSLDEIVDTLKLFTNRCNILLSPFLQLTDFLSTQQSATLASTAPLLTTLFIRILFLTPLWIVLTLSPLKIITTKRVILILGTISLTWHSRPARVSRVILWRSRTVRRISCWITGLSFPGIENTISTPANASSKSATSKDETSTHKKPARTSALTAAIAASRKISILNEKNTDKGNEGIRFTFVLWENQRRWIGIGWTSSMLAYERAPWTDEELNSAPSKDKFELPDVEGGVAKWRWCEGSEWTVEGSSRDDGGGADGESKDTSDAADKKSVSGDGGKGHKKSKSSAYVEDNWVYCDTKWRFPRYGQDGWGKYTRRRKWVRDAELLEITPGSTPVVETTPATPPVAPQDTKKNLSSAKDKSKSKTKTLASSAQDQQNRGRSRSPLTINPKAIATSSVSLNNSPAPAHYHHAHLDDNLSTASTSVSSNDAFPSLQHINSSLFPDTEGSINENNSAPSTPTASLKSSSSKRRSGGWFSRRKTAGSIDSVGSLGSTASAESTNDSISTVAEGKQDVENENSNSESSGGSGGGGGGGNDAGSFSLAVDEKDLGDEGEERDKEKEEDDEFVPSSFRGRVGGVGDGWGVGDEVGMELG